MTKKELRKKYLDLRSTLTASEIEERSSRLIHNLVHHFDFSAKKISCFVPIARFGEIHTWSLLERTDVEVYLPVLQSENQLKHLRFKSKSDLRQNSWGILEPVSGDEIQPDQFDFVIVPLLTIDAQGYRVGYGKGFYDQFLKLCKPQCVFIGVYLFEQLETIDDLHSSDIPVHCCVTPSQLLTFRSF